MPDELQFVSAAALSLDTLAAIFTQSFEGYFYPGTITSAVLSPRVRRESIDLLHSLVMQVGDMPAGIALLGLRGDLAWCGGFGVTAHFRGRGLAHALAAAMIDQARQAGAAKLSLEVLTRNERAIKTYQRAGFQPRRDLQVLDWSGAPAEQDGAPPLVELPATILLEHFAALHPAPAAWQRDLPALLQRGELLGLALRDGGDVRAYALLKEQDGGRARIEDFGAQDERSARALLAALQRRFSQLLSVNEPVDSPLTASFFAAGFGEADRQHELWLELSQARWRTANV